MIRMIHVCLARMEPYPTRTGPCNQRCTRPTGVPELGEGSGSRGYERMPLDPDQALGRRLVLTRLGDVSEIGPGGHWMRRNADAEIEGKVFVCGASVVLGHDVVMPPCRVHTQTASYW